ncbi:MAG: CHAT domain-containing protein [bacterium]|jgi:CHAT domain-containing protein
MVTVSLQSAALAQISAGGLGTRVNGSVLGRCLTGKCAVHGGTGVGENLFHRLGQLDTRKGIREVRVDSTGRKNVIVAVTGREGSFLSVPLTLSDSANLFLLSPGGLWLGEGSQFHKVPNLLLSTGVGLNLPRGRFDAFQSERSSLLNIGAGPAPRFDTTATPADQRLVVGARDGGSIVIDRTMLSLEGGLIVDATTGPLILQKAHLHSGNVLRLSGQGYSIYDSSLSAGKSGKLGPIDLRSSQSPFNRSFGGGLIQRTHIYGNQIRLSAGNLSIMDSQIMAPKGWIELQTTNPTGEPADLLLKNTRIDLSPVIIADALSPQKIRRQSSNGIEEHIKNPIPHIGLFSRGNMQIIDSLIDASLLIPPEAHINAEQVAEVLPERSGILFAEASGNLSINSSTLRADASQTLAGLVALEAGKDLGKAISRGALTIRGSRLSSSNGAGGGVLILQADDGLSVLNSSLSTITDRFPSIAGLNPAGGSRPIFFGGQITLFNQSETKPLIVSSSTITANHHTRGGPLSSPFLSSGADVNGFGKFGTANGWTTTLHPSLSGGYLQLYSTGGIRVESDSRLSVSSDDPLGGKVDTIAGTAVLLNSGPAAIEIEDSRIEGRSGPASKDSAINSKAGAMYIYGDGQINLRNSRIDLSSDDPGVNANILAYSLLEIAAGDLLSIQDKSLLIAQPNAKYSNFQLFDSLVPNDGIGVGDPLKHDQVTDRMFANGSGYSGNLVLFEASRSVQDTFTDFKDYLGRFRIIFERVYNDPSLAGTAWPLPLTSAPIGTLPPQPILRQPVANEEVLINGPGDQTEASQQLLEGQQRALADTVASLGLAPGSGRVRSMAELQLRLLRIQQLASTNSLPATPVADTFIATSPYRPAILQLGLTELAGDQAQINGILLLANGQPFSFSQTVSANQIRSIIRKFQYQLSRRESIDSNQSSGNELSRLLLQPVAVELQNRGVNALLLAVDRGLQAIPYGALPFGNQLLAERFALSVSPSLGLLDLDAEWGSTDGQLLAAGASRFQQPLEPLPMVPRELMALAGEHGASLLIDEAFTEEALQRQAQQVRFRRLHIATHAEFQPGQEATAKLFTKADSISLKALRRSLLSRPQDRAMDLITLSACHTALGDEESELGFVGMALQAGSRSAIGTLWEVDDSATAAFFIQFYRYLASGLEKDQALQATARAFRNGSVRLEGADLIGPRVTAAGDAILLHVDSPEERRRLLNGLRHPHYWAGMVLTGSPW